MHITVYTAPHCQYCHQVKDYLKQRHLPFFEIPTDHNLSAIKTVQQLTQDLVVPVTVVAQPGRSDIVIVGFDQPKLDNALRQLA